MKENLESFLRSCNTIVSNINSFINTGKPSAKLVIEDCDELLASFVDVRQELSRHPAVAKRSLNFLYSLLMTCRKNLEDVHNSPDLNSLRSRLLTNNTQLRNNINSFSVMVVD